MSIREGKQKGNINKKPKRPRPNTEPLHENPNAKIELTKSEKIYKKIEEINKVEPLDTIPKKLTKLNEELGEFSEAYLNGDSKEHILEELSDIIIMVLDMGAHYDFTHENIIHMIDKKLKKWESKYND